MAVLGRGLSLTSSAPRWKVSEREEPSCWEGPAPPQILLAIALSCSPRTSAPLTLQGGEGQRPELFAFCVPTTFRMANLSSTHFFTISSGPL